MNEDITDEDLAYLNENIDIVIGYGCVRTDQIPSKICKVTRLPYQYQAASVYVYMCGFGNLPNLPLYTAGWQPMLEYVKERANSAAYVFK